MYIYTNKICFNINNIFKKYIMKIIDYSIAQSH